MTNECEGVQADAHILEWKLPEFCKLAKIPAANVNGFSHCIRGIAVEHKGSPRTGQLPYQSDIVPLLDLLIKKLAALDTVLPIILGELRDPVSVRGTLLRAGLGAQNDDFADLESRLRLLKKAAGTAKKEAAGFPKKGAQIKNAQFGQVVKSLLLGATLNKGGLKFSAAFGDSGYETRIAKGSLIQALHLLRPHIPSVISERLDTPEVRKNLEDWRAAVNKELKKHPP